MKLRSYLIYLIILALLGGYYAYFEVYRKEQKEKLAEEERKVFHVLADDIREVKLSPAGGPPIVLVREDEKSWIMREPLQTPADRMEVEELINYLNRVERKMVAAEEVKDPKQFGFDAPSLVIAFREKEQWKELVFGDDNPVSRDYYAKTGDHGEVFVVAESTYRLLNKDLFTLRDKSVFSLRSSEIEEVEIRKGDFQARLSKDSTAPEKWVLSGEESFRVSTEKVEDVIRQFSWLRASAFDRETDENLAEYGLEPPRASLNLKKDDTVETLLLGAIHGNDKIYVKRGEKPGVMSVDSRYLGVIPNSLALLEDRTVLSLDVDEVRAAAWKSGQGEYRLSREKDLWKWESPEELKGRKIEAWSVESALWKLKSLEFSSLPKEGDAPADPEFSVTLKGEDGPLAELEIAPLGDGREEKAVTVRSEGRESRYLALGSVLGDITRRFETLKDAK